MEFKVGDSVKIKKGIRCPDDESLSIAGWQGWIIDTDGDLVGIRWDSLTLKTLPKKYIRYCDEEGFDWAELFLSPDKIESAEPRDSKADSDAAAEQMGGDAFWG